MRQGPETTSWQIEEGEMERFYGKYRAYVTANLDPLQMGRVKISVPAVPAAQPNWAMPCIAFNALHDGASLLPPVGAPIWIEFEGGDPNYPIWCGTFWGEGEGPQPASTGAGTPTT